MYIYFLWKFSSLCNSEFRLSLIRFHTNFNVSTMVGPVWVKLTQLYSKSVLVPNNFNCNYLSKRLPRDLELSLLERKTEEHKWVPSQVIFSAIKEVTQDSCILWEESASRGCSCSGVSFLSEVQIQSQMDALWVPKQSGWYEQISILTNPISLSTLVLHRIQLWSGWWAFSFQVFTQLEFLAPQPVFSAEDRNLE